MISHVAFSNSKMNDMSVPLTKQSNNLTSPGNITLFILAQFHVSFLECYSLVCNWTQTFRCVWSKACNRVANKNPLVLHCTNLKFSTSLSYINMLAPLTMTNNAKKRYRKMCQLFYTGNYY